VPSDATITELGLGGDDRAARDLQQWAARMGVQLHLDLRAAPAGAGHGTSRDSLDYDLTLRRDAAGRVHVEIVATTLAARQRALSRAAELLGVRFWSPGTVFVPETLSERTLPRGARRVERHRQDERLTVRGFAPHTFHPIPLGIAMQTPGPASIARRFAYIDWLARTGQNYLQLPIVPPGRGTASVASRLVATGIDVAEWDRLVPHLTQIVEYARSRGVRVAANVSFANFGNVTAMSPLMATLRGVALAATRSVLGVTAAQEDGNAGAIYRSARSWLTRGDEGDIERLVNQLMRVPWGELSWNVGSTEFSTPGDDVTVAWLDDAAAIMARRFPGVRTSVTSHVPSHPHAPTWNEPYFNSVRHAGADVGVLVHTTHAYGVSDPAPVYGNRTFEHKLDMLVAASATEARDPSQARREWIWYPETAYWLNHDTTVPLFLPVYALTRMSDLERVRRERSLDGQVVFTSAREWGYWLVDYVVAQSHVGEQGTLAERFERALDPLGPEAARAYGQLLERVAREQHRALIVDGGIRHVQGFDSLSELGRRLNEAPAPIRALAPGTNSTPNRTPLTRIARMSRSQLAAFDPELRSLERHARELRAAADAARSLVTVVTGAASGRAVADELADSLEVTALRVEQTAAALRAAWLRGVDRAAGTDEHRGRIEELVRHVQQITARAAVAIADRERDYADPPELTTATDHSPASVWPGRYLTAVHDMRYWNATVAELLRATAR
jgi:hypothetical protein